jgi:hypothetical protein
LKKKHLKLMPPTGNVFEDLGFKDAKERLAKARLKSLIEDIADEYGWSQKRPPVINYCHPVKKLSQCK